MKSKISIPSRRAFLKSSTLAVCAMSSNQLFAKEKPTLKVGLLTDLHFADKKTAGTRHYRDSLVKIKEAVKIFNEKKITFGVELGDFIDRAVDVPTELRYLNAIEKEYKKLKADRHYVIGNHCVDTLTKKQFLKNCGAKREYYSFDKNGFHFVILDACFKKDGTPYGNKNFTWTDTWIPQQEQKWLIKDLKKTKLPVIIFAHQRLDKIDAHGVKNSPQIRKILEARGDIVAVFQGHSHKNDIRWLKGIPYITLSAAVEGPGIKNGAYSVLDIYSDGSLKLDGFRTQKDYSLKPRKSL